MEGAVYMPLKNQGEIKRKGETELRFISLKADTTFKYLYKNERTRKWFDRIIKEKFGINLREFELVDNELNTGNKVKDYRLDLNLQKGNTIVILEMNQDYYQFLEAKSYQYLYRVAGKRFYVGEDYESTQTKLILFNDFRNPKMKELKTGNYMFMDPETNLIIEDIESFEIYLPNFKNSCYDNNEVDVSLSLFSASSYDSMRELTNNPKDLIIIEELERLAMDEKFLFEYDHEIDRKKTENSIRKESYENGLQDGLEQGEKNKQVEIVKAMIEDGVSIDKVSSYVDLSVDEINKIINKS